SRSAIQVQWGAEEAGRRRASGDGDMEIAATPERRGGGGLWHQRGQPPPAPPRGRFPARALLAPAPPPPKPVPQRATQPPRRRGVVWRAAPQGWGGCQNDQKGVGAVSQRPHSPASQAGRGPTSSWASVPESPSRSIAVIFPPLSVKLKTTRGRPPTAHTTPVIPLMSASLAALARPKNMAATASAPRTSGSAPVRTAAWSARTTTSGSRTATSAPRSPLRE